MSPDDIENPQVDQNESSDPGDVNDAIADAQSSLDEVKSVVEDAAAPAAGGESNVTTATLAGEQVADDSGIDMLGDVDLQVVIELGRTQMLVEDVLKLRQGSVVELDKLAGDPVDVYVNQRLVARGEVLVLNDNFCVRINEIVADLEQQAEAALQEQIETG